LKDLCNNEWLARPGFTKLGAKWVEVTVWGRMKMRFNQSNGMSENVASNNPLISFRLWPMSKPWVSRSALLSRI
jgi:hypothetical protein